MRGEPVTTTAPMGQQVWLFAAQLSAAGLLTLALYWAGRPAASYQLLLLLAATALIIIACVPAWRRGGIAGIIGGLALATACWLAAGKTLPDINGIDPLITAYIPLLAPVLAGAALILAVWGSVARAEVRDDARFGVAALVGALLITLASLLFQLFYARVGLHNIVESYQLAELYASAWLYAMALWLGSVGVRPAGRLNFQPLLVSILLFAFFIYWQMPGK